MFSKCYQFTNIIKTLLCLCHYGSSLPSVIGVVPWFGVHRNAAFLKYVSIALEMVKAVRREESRQKHEHCLVNIFLLNVTSWFLKSCKWYWLSILINYAPKYLMMSYFLFSQHSHFDGFCISVKHKWLVAIGAFLYVEENITWNKT